MATTEVKAKQFAQAIEEAADAALNRLKIARDDVNVRVEVDVQSVLRVELPREKTDG